METRCVSREDEDGGEGGGGFVSSAVGLSLLNAFRTSFCYLVGLVFTALLSLPVLLLSKVAKRREGGEGRYQDAESFFEHVTIRANGVDFHGLRYKSKKKKSSAARDRKLILMLHGFPETSWSYRYQLQHLGEEGCYETVALDLRGMGDSGGSVRGQEYSCDALVKDVVGVVHSLGYDKCFLVGHDIGGILAWCVVKAAASVVEKLVILNAPHPYVYYQNLSLSQFLKSYYMFIFLYPVVPETMLSLNAYDFVEKGIVLENRENLSESDVDILKRNLFDKGKIALTCMLNYYRSFVFPCLYQQKCPQVFSCRDFVRSSKGSGDPSQSAVAGRGGVFPERKTTTTQQRQQQTNLLDWSMPIDVETLVIWGLGDTFLDHKVCLGSTLQQVVRNLHVVKLQECSHWTNQDQPHRVSQEILKHIRRA